MIPIYQKKSWKYIGWVYCDECQLQICHTYSTNPVSNKSTNIQVNLQYNSHCKNILKCKRLIKLSITMLWNFFVKYQYQSQWISPHFNICHFVIHQTNCNFFLIHQYMGFEFNASVNRLPELTLLKGRQIKIQHQRSLYIKSWGV